MVKRVRPRRVCKCGCGSAVNPGKTFLSGHNSKLPESRKKLSKMLKGEPFSEEHKRKLVIAAKTKPKVSEETKKRLSAINSGENHWAYGLRGKDNPNYGAKRTEKAKLAISKASKIRNSGDGNPNWQGGKSKEPYCKGWLTYEFKQAIFRRDNHTCQSPNCKGISERIVRHHIDGNKQNCCCLNIITLCNSCAMIAEGRRTGGRSRTEWNTILNQITIRNEIEYDLLQQE